VVSEPLILALNCGSSSLKFGVYRAAGKDAEVVCEGEAEEIGNPNSSFWFKSGNNRQEHKAVCPDHGCALAQALDLLEREGLKQFWRAGHRVVHGGPEVRKHQPLTEDVFQKLQAAVPFAPLHLPASLAVIAAVREKMPDLQQILCLDTAFHRNMPDVARTYALPENLRKKGVERFGFHGLSLESILYELQPVPANFVVAHLGNGSSVTAIQQGQSIDTTMGLTPAGGLIMGTRCGDLDPGVMIFLVRHGLATADELEDLVNRKSGLLGVSGMTNDVRQLLEARSHEPLADLALRMFCLRVRKAIAAMAAALGGLDMLVFTGGIGEHADQLRKEICEKLSWIQPFEMRVLPSEEDLQIARIVLSQAKD
jgi:acetate kinase